MGTPASFTCRETLRDGTAIEIRALRPEDEVGMLSALDQTSTQTRQLRFFAPKRHFSDRERAYFMEIDFVNHVALVACAKGAGRDVIIGGGRYVVATPGCAEMAFVVVDAWQGRGVGTLLAQHLIALAREAGLAELIAEVMSDNTAMRRVFERLGFSPAAKRDPQTVHLTLKLT
ncbi:GNAT family N-acetyltransferase [Bradyrhizobium liaoningense]|uniref:GNAT family N-acetyltransferase n=1 Tax=Bradyrhizobium liaoningense TaxID=43992 RepID=UPI001BA5DD8A|nr:GNAT family N-acetyltransferase [Bradyrhizobium liaoningense]MBR0706569.1 GNAT family N-acetyltransferase [Bradyrhizobium liaoningense]